MWAEQGHSFPPWQGAHTPPHPVVGVARGRQRPVLQGPLLQGAVPESPSLDPWLLHCHIPLLLCFFFFFFWPPHSIWSSWARDQIQAAAAATLDPDPTVLGQEWNLHPGAAAMPRSCAPQRELSFLCFCSHLLVLRRLLGVLVCASCEREGWGDRGKATFGKHLLGQAE